MFQGVPKLSSSVRGYVHSSCTSQAGQKLSTVATHTSVPGSFQVHDLDADTFTTCRSSAITLPCTRTSSNARISLSRSGVLFLYAPSVRSRLAARVGHRNRKSASTSTAHSMGLSIGGLLARICHRYDSSICANVFGLTKFPR